MRIALLSDVHGNLPAFEAVLADVDSASVEEIWCLGDLVGYGAEPTAASSWRATAATSAWPATTTWS